MSIDVANIELKYKNSNNFPNKISIFNSSEIDIPIQCPDCIHIEHKVGTR